jgi:hypothetical protein
MSESKRQPSPLPKQKRITRRELVETLNELTCSLDPRKLKIMAQCAGYSVEIFLAARKHAVEVLKRLSEEG